MWALAWRNLWRAKRRSLLTLLAIVVMIYAMLFMLSFQIGAYSMMVRGDMTLLSGYGQVQNPQYHKEQQFKYTLQNYSKYVQLLSQQGIGSSAYGRSFALLSSEKRTQGALILGIDEYFTNISRLPGLVKKGHFLHKSSEILLGSALAKRLGIKVGDEVILLGTDKSASLAVNSFQVAGLIHSGFDQLDKNLALINLEDFQSTFALNIDEAHGLLLDKNMGFNLFAQAKPLDNQAWLYPWQMVAEDTWQLILMDASSASFMYLMLWLFILLTLLNTQWMVQRERQHEFGILLALGMPLKQLKNMVWLETVILLVLGISMAFILEAITLYVLGDGIRFESMEAVYRQFGMEGTIYLFFQWPLLLVPFFVLVTVSLFARWPLSRLAQLQITQVLRGLT